MRGPLLYLLAWSISTVSSGCHHSNVDTVPDSPFGPLPIVDLTTQTMTAVPLQLLSITSVEPIFSTSTSITVLWLPDGDQPTPPASQAIAATHSHLVFAAPEIHSGDYQVFVNLGATAGRVSMQLRPPPPASDPPELLTRALSARLQATRDHIATVTDLDLAAALHRDLNRAGQHCAELETALVTLTTAARARLGQWLAANPTLLTELEPAPAGVSSQPAGARQQTVLELLTGADTALASGLGWFVGGSLTQPATTGALPGLVHSASRGFGSLLVVGAQVDATNALAIPIRPRPPLSLALAGRPAQPLQFESGSPQSVELSAELTSLSTLERDHPARDVRAAATATDRLVAAFASLQPDVTANFSARPAALPPVGHSARGPIETSGLRLGPPDQAGITAQFATVGDYGQLTLTTSGSQTRTTRLPLALTANSGDHLQGEVEVTVAPIPQVVGVVAQVDLITEHGSAHRERHDEFYFPPRRTPASVEASSQTGIFLSRADAWIDHQSGGLQLSATARITTHSITTAHSETATAEIVAELLVDLPRESELWFEVRLDRQASRDPNWQQTAIAEFELGGNRVTQTSVVPLRLPAGRHRLPARLVVHNRLRGQPAAATPFYTTTAWGMASIQLLRPRAGR